MVLVILFFKYYILNKRQEDMRHSSYYFMEEARGEIEELTLSIYYDVSCSTSSRTPPKSFGFLGDTTIRVNALSLYLYRYSCPGQESR